MFNKWPVPSNILRNFISKLITKIIHGGWITGINIKMGHSVNSVSHAGNQKSKRAT
jgi:hypothetical protein